MNFDFKAVWPNGKASDYESEDSGFDPQLGHAIPVPFFVFRLNFLRCWPIAIFEELFQLYTT